MFRPIIPTVLAACVTLAIVSCEKALADASDSSPSPTVQPTHASINDNHHTNRGMSPQAPIMLAQQASPAVNASLTTVASNTSVKQAVHQQTVSDAERITNLQRAIEADQQALKDIEAALAAPDSEYQMAEAEFKEVDGKLAEIKQALKHAQEEDVDDEVQRLKSESEKLQSQWKLAKDRFDLAIQERKTIQEKAANLKQKLQQEVETLDKLTGVAKPPAKNADRPSDESSATSPTTDPNGSTPTPNAPVAEPSPLPSPVAAAPVNPATPAQDTSGATPQSANGVSATPTPQAATPAAPEEKPPSKELRKATLDAEKKEVVAQEAEQEVQSVMDRIALLRRDIELEKQLLATARKKADVAHETEEQLQQQYEDMLREDADATAIDELRTKLSQTRQRFRESRRESRERVNRIDELQSRYATLQSEQIVALQLAEKARIEAESAKKTVAALRNPFTTRNIVQWLIDHGPRVAAIVFAMLMALWMMRITKFRIIDLMLKRNGDGKRVDRENRARTLVGVFENAAKVAIVCGGFLMVLDAIGAPITTLLGGAAVFGLAVAFGAQSLIKDYFYGFMILLEQQYTINDVIKIGDIAGQVERITLRMTVLRDLEGRVHFIPHGAITSTTNMTHGWSRALFDIGVAYKEDTDRVIDVIKQLGTEMRSEPKFGPLLLEDLTMLGVDAFGESAVVIKFFIKTQPLKQWEVKRELLRRIKRTFDEQGIEIPFPHRTVYHRDVETGEVNVNSHNLLRKSA